MVIYLDAVFFLNLFFDFLLLMTVSITLKRNAKVSRIIIGSLIGTISFFTLYFSFQTISLFIFKVLLSIIMILVTFGLKDKKYLMQNLSYFYMTSTVLGGFLYFLNLSFSNEVKGLVFVQKNFSCNYLFLVIISPFILYVYNKQRKEINHYENIYPVEIHFKNGQNLLINGFLDTGNKLVDPITKKKIILINEDKIKGLVPIRSPMYVPYNSLNHHGIIRCIAIETIEIMGIQSPNYLLGLSEEDLLKDGVDCVLNSFCLEEFL